MSAELDLALYGKRIVVTRAERQAQEMGEMIRQKVESPFSFL
ncbi:hypothetical protein [Caldalkalibacillus mannanilyticus]|nr:hypothetical protein [Caldalkalibacillus mannanilyticus]